MLLLTDGKIVVIMAVLPYIHCLTYIAYILFDTINNLNWIYSVVFFTMTFFSYPVHCKSPHVIHLDVVFTFQYLPPLLFSIQTKYVIHTVYIYHNLCLQIQR